uniref:BED-type domain-containing protein n=1 Tax=Romanomermis culicivorax TaxID=13658 RepID=A0A915IDS2_ROMCU
MPAKKVAFQSSWINPDLHKKWAEWLRAVPNDKHSAYCKLCKKSFSLSNMGRQAIVSHSTLTKHLDEIKASSSTSNIHTLMQRRSHFHCSMQ